MTTNPISLIITSDATISAQLEAIGLTVKILVINSVTGNPIPHAKVYVEGGTTTLQTTDTTGVVYWQGFKTEDVNKTFICRVADSGTETYLNYTNSFQLRGLANETWTVSLSNSNNSAKCYLLSEKTLAPVNDAAISIYDQSMNPSDVPDVFTENGLAEWTGLVLEPGEYLFYYSDPNVEPGETPITAMSNPFDAILSDIHVVRYMFINPPTVQTYSALEIHVENPDGFPVRSARVELTYNGESNLANTDNKGIAVFYGVPTGTEISYTITAAGYNAATGKWIIPTNVEYETEYVVLSPLVNYDFKLTIGQNYDVEMGFYQSGFFKNDFGGISPAQFMQHTIEKVGIDAIMDTMTGMYTANTLTVALTGDTRSAISQITIYVADSMYTLNTVIYNGGVTYYSFEMLDDTTVLDYFDKRNGQTINIQLIDEKPSTTYNIMMGIAIGGSASSNKETAAEGEQVTFTAMPDVGSEFLNWEIMKDGESTPMISIDNPLTYTMPACNIGVTPVFNEGNPPVPSDPITLVFKVTGTDGPPSGYTIRFTYPDGSLIFEGTTKALGTVRMNTADHPMYAVDGMIATATNGSNTGTITINAADVTEDKANPSGEILFEIPVITTGTLGSSNAKDAKTTITIPAGVNVIKFKDVYIGVTPNKTYNIKKQSFALGNEFRLSVSSDAKGYWRETVYTTTVFNELTLSFEYGPEINLATPTVTDY